MSELPRLEASLSFRQWKWETAMILDRETGRTAVEAPAKERRDPTFDGLPPAGPHDRPELTNFDACPGCGLFPTQQLGKGIESDPGGG
jgi:hypothetical protein